MHEPAGTCSGQQSVGLPETGSTGGGALLCGTLKQSLPSTGTIRALDYRAIFSAWHSLDLTPYFSHWHIGSETFTLLLHLLFSHFLSTPKSFCIIYVDTTAFSMPLRHMGNMSQYVRTLISHWFTKAKGCLHRFMQTRSQRVCFPKRKGEIQIQRHFKKMWLYRV